MNNRIAHLRIKVRTLQAEAQIIRHEERKTRGYAKHTLAEHRRGVVRRAARHNLLAYVFLKGGVPYAKVETNVENEPEWYEVKKLVKRFGGDADKVEAWRKGEPTSASSPAP